MISTNNNKKEATPVEVVTARMPIWLFELANEFRKIEEIPTRSDALNILVMLGLRHVDLIDRKTCSEFLDSLIMTQIPESFISKINGIKRLC